jgi:tripartite-type tricarboxylate transporter receptor subunit TctC
LACCGRDLSGSQHQFIVPFAAGSATDALARIVGEHASKTLGQSIIIENMAGANGSGRGQRVEGNCR